MSETLCERRRAAPRPFRRETQHIAELLQKIETPNLGVSEKNGFDNFFRDKSGFPNFFKNSKTQLLGFPKKSWFPEFFVLPQKKLEPTKKIRPIRKH